MPPPPSLAGLRPLLRTLVPTLLYTAALEMFISRFLVRGGMFWLRGGRPGPRFAAFLDSLGYTFFNFSVVMAIGLLCVIGFASRPLRIWPSPWSTWIGPGLVLFSLWSLLRAFVPSLAPEGLYHLTSLVLALGLLSAFFTESVGTGQRTFAVLLAAALVCSAWNAVSEGLRRLDALALPMEGPSGQAGELLALAAGAVAPGLIPHRQHDRLGRTTKRLGRRVRVGRRVPPGIA